MHAESENVATIGRSHTSRFAGMMFFAMLASTGLGLLEPVKKANAEIIVWNIDTIVPFDANGLYVNILTGDKFFSSPTNANAPYINPFGSLNNQLGWGSFGNGDFHGVNIGNPGVEVSALPTNFVVGSSIPDFGGDEDTRFNPLGTSYLRDDNNPFNGDFLPQSLNYFGFRFRVGTDLHYGWGSMNIGDDMLQRTLVQIAFNSVAGQSIAVAAVPEPSSLALLATSAFGFAAWRRSRRTRTSKLMQ